jgi:hypothetical protein
MRISECQVFVDEGDRHAAFANAAGNALDGTVTNVARAEDAGDAGFKANGSRSSDQLVMSRPVQIYPLA